MSGSLDFRSGVRHADVTTSLRSNTEQSAVASYRPRLEDRCEIGARDVGGVRTPSIQDPDAIEVSVEPGDGEPRAREFDGQGETDRNPCPMTAMRAARRGMPSAIGSCSLWWPDASGAF